MPKRQPSRWLPLALLLLASVGVAGLGCGSSDSGSNGADGGADGGYTGPGDVCGAAYYAGTMQGPLVVALFPSFPPVGFPVALQAVTQTWPGTAHFDLPNVPPGHYFTVAYIGSSNTGPVAGDPLAQPQPIDVAPGNCNALTLTLVDVAADAGLLDAATD